MGLIPTTEPPAPPASPGVCVCASLSPSIPYPCALVSLTGAASRHPGYSVFLSRQFSFVLALLGARDHAKGCWGLERPNAAVFLLQAPSPLAIPVFPGRGKQLGPGKGRRRPSVRTKFPGCGGFGQGAAMSAWVR